MAGDEDGREGDGMKVSTVGRVVFLAALAACLVRPAAARADDDWGEELPLVLLIDGLGAVITIAGPLASAGFTDLYRAAYATELEPLDPQLIRTRNVHFVQAGIGGLRTGLSAGLLAHASTAKTGDVYYQRLAGAVLVQAGFDAVFAGLSIGELVRFERDRRLSTVERESDAWIASVTPLMFHGILGVGMGLVSGLEFLLGGLYADLGTYEWSGRSPHRRVRVAFGLQGLGVGIQGSF